MNKILSLFSFIGILFVGNLATVAPATAVESVRGALIQTPTASNGARGKAGLANAYKNNQRNTYFMVTQPDVDTACRTKIYNCLAKYCGDVTVVPGQVDSKCKYATETELYNYALLCLQTDNEILLPQYGVNTKNGLNGMNTAARLCPSYVQQELLSYLSMANLATQLSKSNSALCLQRRQELEAAMACHSVAMTYGNETDSKLNAYLTDFCGAGVPGGSAEMVARFANAGNVGANIWGWAENIINLKMNSKGEDWQAAVDAVLAHYTNRMNLACGDNLQLNTTSSNTTPSGTSAVQTVIGMAVGASLQNGKTNTNTENPYEKQSLWMEVMSRIDVYTSDEAYQVVNAAIVNPATVQNAYLTPVQMDNMRNAYINGTKVFILRDGARCHIVPVTTLTAQETTAVANSFASCVSK